MNRVEIIQHLIRQHRAQGIIQAEIHMSRPTYDEFVAEAKIVPTVPPDNRSLIARIRFPEDAPKPKMLFEGLTVVENDKVPGQSIVLRPLQYVNDPDWLEKYITFPTQQPTMPAEGTPWIRRVESETPQQADTVGLDDLTTEGGVNPTTVLLKAMEGLDRVQDVVVVRFYRNHDVDLCSTFDRMAVMGALQMALGYVMRQE